MELEDLGDDFNEAPAGRHAYAELHFYTTQLHSVYKYSGFKIVLLLVLQLLPSHPHPPWEGGVTRGEGQAGGGEMSEEVSVPGVRLL